MKKKEIEKIPYLTAEKKSGKKFVAVTAFKTIKEERHLFVEIYENKKKKLQVPVLRLVYTKRDWGIYWPAEEGRAAVWSSCGIRDEYGRNRWEGTEKESEKDTFIADEDKARIYEHAGEKEGKGWRSWSRELSFLEDKIRYDRRERTEEKRQKDLEERIKDMPELPEGLNDWCEKVLFKGVNFIYYKREGKKATFTCSHCGKTYTERIKRSGGYGGEFEHIVETPAEGKGYKCEKCGTIGTCKPIGRAKGLYGMERCCYVGQKFRNGVVIRYISVEKIMSANNPERYVPTEIARNYFEPGRRIKKDYHLYDGWNGKEVWDCHNIGGYQNILQKEAAVYPETFETLRESYLQYSGMEEWVKRKERIRVIDYLQAYIWHPYLELLVKAKMDKLVEKVVGCYMGELKLNDKAKKPADMFRIRKEHLKMFVSAAGDPDVLKILQIEREGGYQWTDEECEKLIELWPSKDQLRMLLEYMTLRKYLNYVEKNAGASFGTGCATAKSRLKHISTTYLDYLTMRKACGYQMDNSVYLFPRSLEDAHRKMLAEHEKEAVDKRIEEVELKFPDIRKNYRKLRNRFFYEDEQFMIRPAKSAGEIVQEGRILHHCVGGDNYLRKHNEGKYYILMLRFKEEPEIPYITVEVQGTGMIRIMQWYGAHDKKPDEKNMNRWLDAYITRLKCETAGEETWQQEEQLLARA